MTNPTEQAARDTTAHLAGLRDGETIAKLKAAQAEPHYLGLQNGDVKTRWIDRQPLVDRILMQCVWAVTIVAGITALGLWLL